MLYKSQEGAEDYAGECPALPGEAPVGEDHGLKTPFPQVPQSYQENGYQPAEPGLAFGYHLHSHRDGLYLPGGILDAYSRRVIGYAVSIRLDTALTLEALKMAIAWRQPGTGVIHHSDEGAQYASSEDVDELKSHDFLVSMVRVGNPYENVMMESFFKTLKYEEVYNQKRLHSALGYRSPNDFERLLRIQENNGLPLDSPNPYCPIIEV